MENIRFANKEHETFYFDMLAATRNNDTFHKAFFYTVGISAETRSNIRALFDFKEDIIKPEGLSAHGRPAERAACAVLPLTFGTAGRRMGKKTAPRWIRYLKKIPDWEPEESPS